MPLSHLIRSYPRGPLGSILFGLIIAASSSGAVAATGSDPGPCCDYSVFGTVYHDLDADGMRGPSEPGIAGWVVEVLDSTDRVVSSTPTDAAGGYSFALPVGCGQTFRLRQLLQSGWEQSFPATNGMHTGVGAGCGGEVLGPFDFANFSCMKPPLNLVAWWLFDETSGIVTQEIVAGNDGLDINSPAHVAGKFNNALLFNGSNTYVRVNDESRINLGTSDITIDAWIRTSSPATYQGIVDKRTLTPFERGYALYLRQGRLALRLGDGTAANQVEYWSPTTPYLPDGAWHHVAAVEQRTGTNAGTRLYVDGSLIASFPPFTASGNTSNISQLIIGASWSTSGPTQHFDGEIDELELFDRALSELEISAIYKVLLGKCKQYCQVPWDQTICANQDHVTVQINICNFVTAFAAPQSYNLSFGGLPNGSSGAAGGCSYNGPTTFQVVPTQPIVVPYSTCQQVAVKIFRPSGMPKGTVSCYEVTITNKESGFKSTCRGAIFASNAVCPVPKSESLVEANTSTAAPVQFTIRSTSAVPVVVPFSVIAMPSDMDSGEPNVMSLNGLPPGTPVVGVLAIDPGDSADVDVSAIFTEPAVLRFYDVVLVLDTDDDGTPDAQTSSAIRYAEQRAPGWTGVLPLREPQFVLFPVAPNPLRDVARVEYTLPAKAQVRVGLFEIGGRRVRTLVDGVREAGRYALALDADRLPIGVYFLRLEANGRSVTRRVVLLK